LKTFSKRKIRFSHAYFLIGLALLFIEILIGLFVHDGYIRPYGGDFLVVILLYCLIKTIFDLPTLTVASSVLLFAYMVEWSQYLKLADDLHLSRPGLARTILGDYFSWTDMGCYTMGFVCIILVEKYIGKP
jgi:hypothetical protein